VDQFDEAFALFFTLEVQNIDNIFNKTEELSIYRFIQEAINNIIKHAQAKAVTIEVMRNKGQITITIEDNGVGFDLDGKRNSLGLKTMRERIKFLKGQFEIESKPSNGTKIRAIFKRL
jgi:signal transduction histidine kinase